MDGKRLGGVKIIFILIIKKKEENYFYFRNLFTENLS